MKRWIVVALLALAPLVARPSFAEQPASGSVQPKKQGRLMFVATTGLEDVGTLSSSFRHAIAAKKSGHLEDVVWLSYGRAVVALDPTVTAVPDEVRRNAEAAQKAGVRLVACRQALKKYGIDEAKLVPRAEVADNAIVELSRLVADGYQLIRY